METDTYHVACSSVISVFTKDNHHCMQL